MNTKPNRQTQHSELNLIFKKLYKIASVLKTETLSNILISLRDLYKKFLDKTKPCDASNAVCGYYINNIIGEDGYIITILDNESVTNIELSEEELFWIEFIKNIFKEIDKLIRLGNYDDLNKRINEMCNDFN